MFKRLRKKRFIKFTMWLLVAAFIIWGAGSAVYSRKNYAGIIFGKKISPQEYNRSYVAILNRAKIIHGDNLAKVEKFLNLKAQAWERLILEYEAKRRLIRTSNKEVIERIAGLKFFQRNGVFDKRLYTYIVENIFRTTPREFEESVRGDIIIEKLMSSIVKDVKVTDEEVIDAYRDQYELADISFFLIKSEDYKDKVVVEEEELLPFYEGHKENFLGSISVNVDYLGIPFNDNKEDARFLADEIMAYLKRGEPLKAASKEYGIMLKETGFFSIDTKIPEIGLSYPFILAALRLEKGQISDVIEASDSFYIMQLKSKRPPSVLPFEEVKERVRRMLTLEKAEGLALAFAEKILAQIQEESKTLEDAATELKKELIIAREVSRKSYIKEVGISDSFSDVAFSLKQGEIGGPAKTQKGYAIIELNNLKPIDEDEFQKAKEEFADNLLEDKKNKYFQDWFKNLKERAALKDNMSLRR